MMPLNRLLFVVLWSIVCRHGMMFGVSMTGLQCLSQRPVFPVRETGSRTGRRVHKSWKTGE